MESLESTIAEPKIHIRKFRGAKQYASFSSRKSRKYVVFRRSTLKQRELSTTKTDHTVKKRIYSAVLAQQNGKSSWFTKRYFEKSKLYIQRFRKTNFSICNLVSDVSQNNILNFPILYFTFPHLDEILISKSTCKSQLLYLSIKRSPHAISA